MDNAMSKEEAILKEVAMWTFIFTCNAMSIINTGLKENGYTNLKAVYRGPTALWEHYFPKTKGYFNE